MKTFTFLLLLLLSSISYSQLTKSIYFNADAADYSDNKGTIDDPFLNLDKIEDEIINNSAGYTSFHLYFYAADSVYKKNLQ